MLIAPSSLSKAKGLLRWENNNAQLTFCSWVLLPLLSCCVHNAGQHQLRFAVQICYHRLSQHCNHLILEYMKHLCMVNRQSSAAWQKLHTLLQADQASTIALGSHHDCSDQLIHAACLWRIGDVLLTGTLQLQNCKVYIVLKSCKHTAMRMLSCNLAHKMLSNGFLAADLLNMLCFFQLQQIKLHNVLGGHTYGGYRQVLHPCDWWKWSWRHSTSSQRHSCGGICHCHELATSHQPRNWSCTRWHPRGHPHQLRWAMHFKLHAYHHGYTQ